ncbi:protein SFI1 homolog [Ptychodera flava]|uniref:protein SFI1 homolog n=1 Tax=Ptychodera flava TaxID=63121 RepID=UPI00396A4FD1
MTSEGRKTRMPQSPSSNSASKAEHFTAKDNQQLRAKAKRAILEELNLQLRVKAEKLKLKARAGFGQRENEADATRESPSDTGEMEAGRTITIATPPSRIPVLKLRQTSATGQADDSPGRQVRSERKGKQRSIVYRPTYDWNRGGRMKEIRIRHLARKFFHIWMQNTYGRVKPSAIRKHYRQTLLRKTFQAWYNEWWSERKEWRLMVRAEYHDRFRLWRQVWSAWKHFVIVERIKNAKKDIATQHANQTILSKVMGNWKAYIQIRRRKQAVYLRAYERANQSLLKYTWCRWKHQLVQKYRQHDMEDHAMQHWASGLLQKAWLTWRQKFAQKQEEKRRHMAADLCYEKSLVSRCFYRGWIEYAVLRREKNQKRAFANQLYREKLQSGCFQHWYNRWYRHRLLAEQGEALEKVANKILIRRMWNRWMKYIDICDDKRRKKHLADEHYKHHLMRMCFTAMHLHRVQRRLQMMRNHMAEQLSQKLRQRRAWNAWMLRCEQNEELKLLPQSRKAQRHYRYKTLKECFQQWRRYIDWRQHRQSQYNAADAHYISRALPKYLFQWRVFVQITKDKNQMNEDAVQFRRSILYSKYFYGWLGAYRTSQDYRMMLRMAILHDDKVIMQKTFCKWRQKLRERLHQADQEEVASSHYHSPLCRKVFTDWKLYRDGNKKAYESERKAARHDYLKTARRSWRAWRQYIEHHQQKKTKGNLADTHYAQKLFKKVITTWKLYTRQSVRTKRIVEEKVMAHNQQLSRWALWQWYEHVKELVEDKALENKATNHWQISIKIKVLKNWHEYTIKHIYRKHCKEQEVMEARQCLDKAKMKRFFRQWIENHKKSVKDKEQLQRAVEHWKRRQYEKTFMAWIKYKQISIRKQLLAKQSMWLHNTRLLTSHFLQWRTHFQNAEEENTKTAIALWQWSLVVQRKALLSWNEYTKEKKRKSQRIAEALDQRRQRLLRCGVSQWLRVATDLSSSRASYAAQQQAKTAYGTMQVVYRCAKHWKEWTQRRKQQQVRGHPKTKIVPIVISASPVRPPERHSMLHQDFQVVDKIMGGVNATQRARPKPRRPDFLVDSLQREGLIEPVTDRIETRQVEPKRYISATDTDVKHIETEKQQLTVEDEIQPRSEPTPMKMTDMHQHEISSVTESEFSEVAEKVTELRGYTRVPDRIPRRLNYEADVETKRPEDQMDLVDLKDKETKTLQRSLPVTPTKSVHILPDRQVTPTKSPGVDSKTTPKKDAPVLLPPSAFTIPSPHLPPSPPRLQLIPQYPTSPLRPQPTHLLPASPPRLKQSSLPKPSLFMSASPEREAREQAAKDATSQPWINTIRAETPPRSRESVLKEVMHIKKQLQEHQANVKQLKVLQRQREQLESFLEDQKHGVNISLNMQADLEQVKGEINMMNLEIAEISEKISSKKEKMRELADRANSLIRQIQ